MNDLQTILTQALPWFIFIPLVAFFVSLPWKNRQEKQIAMIVLATKALYIIMALLFAIAWFAGGLAPISHQLLVLYQSDHFVFAIQFYYDHIAAVYSVVGAVLFFLVCTFSRYYMHRDEGYKRFFNTILFFALGYNLIIFSGNFETMFIGWEVIGLSSFLLIAFYRNRYLPVKNAFKTISNYRVSDVALILAMWMMHHLTHQNITFTELDEARSLAAAGDHTGMAVFIGIMLVLAAMIKSAQIPFTSWLPRAMEGPTSSSAIFYGSLSVHIGVFLLLRTYPFWQDITWLKVLIGVIGAVTGIVATIIARVQPTVKTQIAYSSAAQIGIIFIEVALGFHILALIHFAGNAFLRTYQLLVSPSVLNYLVHHQYFHYHPPQSKKLPGLQASLYVLGIREWNLDVLMRKIFWIPFKWVGDQLQFLASKAALVLVAILAIAFFLVAYYQPSLLASYAADVTVFAMLLALLLTLFSFSHRGSAITAWAYLLFAHLFIVAGICFNTSLVHSVEVLLYVSGILIAFMIGLYCLVRTRAIDGDVGLHQYHGYVYEQRMQALLFLLATIGMLGFPVTAAFIGIDVFFTYVQGSQYLHITLLALCFVFIELAAIRIFLRVYLGLHKKLYHPVAFRSS